MWTQRTVRRAAPSGSSLLGGEGRWGGGRPVGPGQVPLRGPWPRTRGPGSEQSLLPVGGRAEPGSGRPGCGRDPTQSAGPGGEETLTGSPGTAGARLVLGGHRPPLGRDRGGVLPNLGPLPYLSSWRSQMELEGSSPASRPLSAQAQPISGGWGRAPAWCQRLIAGRPAGSAPRLRGLKYERGAA